MGHGVSIFIFTVVLLSYDLNCTYNEIHIDALFFLIFFLVLPYVGFLCYISIRAVFVIAPRLLNQRVSK